MPEDVDPKERIPSLLAERAHIAFQPEAAKRRAEIADLLKELGYDGDLGAEPMETADQPAKRGRPAKSDTA